MPSKRKVSYRAAIRLNDAAGNSLMEGHEKLRYTEDEAYEDADRTWLRWQDYGFVGGGGWPIEDGLQWQSFVGIKEDTGDYVWISIETVVQ